MNERSATLYSGQVCVFRTTVAQRASTTGKVASSACRFCFHFGRELRADASEAAAAGKKSKSKSSTNIVKQFSPPWRTDAYTQHLKLVHKEKSAEYAYLDATAKDVCFEGGSCLPCNYPRRCWLC
jgi:hypothetical protein